MFYLLLVERKALERICELWGRDKSVLWQQEEKICSRSKENKGKTIVVSYSDDLSYDNHDDDDDDEYYEDTNADDKNNYNNRSDHQLYKYDD